MRALHIVLALAFVAAAGCAAEGASTSNFTLTPESVGWYAGDEARFTLAIESSLLHGSPSFTIDRRFAIEEIQLVEKGLKFGGDFETKDPDEVALRLERNGTQDEAFTLDEQRPSLDLRLTLPGDLRDSEYSLELKLFKVGWVKSGTFRVDAR